MTSDLAFVWSQNIFAWSFYGEDPNPVFGAQTIFGDGERGSIPTRRSGTFENATHISKSGRERFANRTLGRGTGLAVGWTTLPRSLKIEGMVEEIAKPPSLDRGLP